jgi:hypothetical protein
LERPDGCCTIYPRVLFGIVERRRRPAGSLAFATTPGDDAIEDLFVATGAD